MNEEQMLYKFNNAASRLFEIQSPTTIIKKGKSSISQNEACQLEVGETLQALH